MNFNLDKLKELWGNKYTKPLLFFGFYFIFFAVVLTIARPSDIPDGDVAEKSIWDGINSNYEYLYEIKLSDGQTISLQGKKFNNKNQFVKRVNDIIDSEAYIFYNQTYVKNGEEWVENNSYIITTDSNVNQYFDINYIKLLIADSELMNSISNFDGSKSDFYKFGNLNIEVISEENVLKKIVIIDPLYKLTLQYKNINEVKDFVVEK